MREIRALLFMLVAFVLTATSAFAAKDADFHFRVKNEVFTKVINQVMGKFVEKDGYLKKQIPSQNIDLKIDLSNHANVEEAHSYANSVLGINLKGENDVKFFIEKPYFQGKLNIGAPRFYALNKAGSKLKVKLDISLENYYLYFKHIWFAESGFTQNSNTQENKDSCQKLIMEERYEGKDIDVSAYKDQYDEFFSKINKSEFYSSIKKNLWVRMDHFQLGWGNSHHGEKYTDDRNKLKIQIEAILDFSPGAQTLKLTKIVQNFGKEGGSLIPLHLPEKNIIVPPIMIRTIRPVVDENGYFVKNDKGVQVSAIRCTPIKLDSAKQMAVEVAKKFSAKLPTYINDDLIKSVVEGVNNQISSMKLDLPTKLEVLSSDVFKNYEEKTSTFMGRSYVYKVPKKVEGDLKEQVKSIIGDFYKYRASLGLYGIVTSNYGKNMTMAFNGGLVIDDHEIAYRERNAKVSYAKNFNFPNYKSENIAVAVSKDMLQRITNLVRDRYLSTNVPEIVNVKISDKSFKISKDGYLVLKPELVVKVKGYEVVSIPGLEVKVKLGFYTSSKDNNRYFNIELKIPNGSSIVNKVKAGKVVKQIEFVTDLILLNPLMWPLVPLKNYVVKPAIKKKLASIVNKYVNQVKNNYTTFNVQDIVDEYGITPRYFEFDQRGHASIFLDFNKVVGFDDTLEELSSTLDNEISNFKLDLDLKF
jgi:hypothetical protein